jgi:uncharacterized protein (TIGR02757 family)
MTRRRGTGKSLPLSTDGLKATLDRLYGAFNYPDSAADPIQIVRRFEAPEDREVAGFIASALAFGRVGSVLQSIERVLAVTGPRPAAFVRAFEPGRQGRELEPIVHRWTRGIDLSALLWILRKMLEQSGSVEGFFLEGHSHAAEDVGPGLDSFSTRALAMNLKAVYGGSRKGTARQSRATGKPALPPNRAVSRVGVGYFFPRPSNGSACKRLNLFLRWMVRHDGLDLGVWTRVAPSQLIVPLDTHIIRVGRCLKLTRYASPGWAMARDITTSLRRLDPDDPVRYDYALCHMSMMNACGFGTRRGDVHCPLKGSCYPGRH